MITNYNICVICNAPSSETHHLVYGRGIRSLADADGLTMPICDKCHRLIHGDSRVGHMSKIIGQLEYEKERIAEGLEPEQARETFRKRYGRSWL